MTELSVVGRWADRREHLLHSNLGTTATYLAGIAPVEVVNAMTARPAPEGSEDA